MEDKKEKSKLEIIRTYVRSPIIIPSPGYKEEIRRERNEKDRA